MSNYETESREGERFSSGGSDRLGGEGPVRVTARSRSDRGHRHSHGTPFFKTGEFIVLVLLSLGILIASAVSNSFGAEQAWRMVMILGVAFIVSRGLAKLGHENDGDDL